MDEYKGWTDFCGDFVASQREWNVEDDDNNYGKHLLIFQKNFKILF